MKQKRENFTKPKKELGRAFANLALAKAQVKNKRSSNFRHKKDIRQARNSKPAINLQKWITKTAKKLTKRQNKTSSAAKSAASYLQKS